MILAGDIGGTNARLALFDVQNGAYKLVSGSVFPSRQYRGLDEIVTKFVSDGELHPNLACFGVAGPVRNGKVETSNLPWVVDSKRLASELRLPSAILINDLEANAWGIAALQPDDVVVLNQVKDAPVGNKAVIAAGTGLGEAGMYWDGSKHHVFASEGGHTDFAPRNELEVDLLNYLRARFGHVSYERIVSGPGLVNVFHFLRDTGRGAEPSWLTEQMASSDPAASISMAALAGKCGLCEHAVDLFVSLYGAEAGNLALKIMATGGVYVGGGIAPKMLPKLAGPLFMQSFTGKGRMQTLLESIPVKVIKNEKLALLGAARYAVANAA
ncbi:MAG: glucokinase [Acidobacteria bacterium]|jgi:glucokinase|nr:MAG: glucokinase [Acidobacteriota bacterium]PYV93214.1 MAG: glucokinase [Acidobacteriota bacterium]